MSSDKNKHFEFMAGPIVPTDDGMDSVRAVGWILLSAILTVILTAIIVWNLMAVPVA